MLMLSLRRTEAATQSANKCDRRQVIGGGMIPRLQ